MCIRITDKRELEIPNIGYIRLEDEESGEEISKESKPQSKRSKKNGKTSNGNGRMKFQIKMSNFS